MINNPIIFYMASGMIIFFAILTIVAKNLIYALLSSIMVFFLGGILFYLLGSEYNAIIQVAVYGLAVPIILGISIMFTSGKKENPQITPISYTTLICMGIFVLGFIYLMLISFAITPNTFNIVDSMHINSYENLRTFARGIFVKYIYAFELLSLLLTIAIVGLTIIQKNKK